MGGWEVCVTIHQFWIIIDMFYPNVGGPPPWAVRLWIWPHLENSRFFKLKHSRVAMNKWIIRYLNRWVQIVLFVFVLGIWSISNFQIIYEYSNSCYRISDSYRIFIKQNVYKKYRKKLHIVTKTKNQILLFSFCLKFSLWKKYY